MKSQEKETNQGNFPSCLISPAPEILEKIIRTRNLIAANRDLTHVVGEGGIDLRTFSMISQRPKNSVFVKAPSKIQTTGTLKAIVLLVDFDDNQHSENEAHYRDMLFSTGTLATGSMRDYFRECSYGMLDVTGDIHGWYRMPLPYAHYTDNQFGTDGDYPKNVQKLVEDAVDAANADVNFSDYDVDGDGIVDALFIIHAGPGAETTGMTKDIWSHRWQISDRTVDGVRVRDYTCESEDGTIGLFCHELTHVWGPDLYDTDSSSRGIGQWCLMAGGSWNGPPPRGRTPAHASAWVKKTLGWLDPTNFTIDQNGVSLVDVENNPKICRVWTGGATGKEYFLIENRQKTRFDSELRSGGLAIWHIDENKNNNSDETHFMVALEQADGNLDLENNANSGDNGDLYRGTSDNSTFNVNSNPNSKSYSGLDTKVSVTNINNSGNVITFNVKVGAGAGAAAAAALVVRENCDIKRVYATSNSAWILIGTPEPAGWRQLAPNTTDMFNIAIQAKTSGKRVNVWEDASQQIKIIDIV